MIQYKRLEETIERLEAQFENLKTLDSFQPQLIQEAVFESVIRRFNVCFDCLWRTLRIYLIKELGLPEVEDNPKPVLRIANENSLLESGIERWLEYADFRIQADSICDKESIVLISSFIKDARDVLTAFDSVSDKEQRDTDF